MKDVTKIISERATRFLPVDMKDRLKSAFNRNSPATAPTKADHEDIPDYTAIFNTNKPAGNQQKSSFNGPLDQTQLAEPTSSVTMRNPARQIGQDIEDAEIVVDKPDEPAATAQDESAATPPWQAASLKTRRAEAPVEAPPASANAPVAQVADDVPDYSAIFKSNKPKAAAESQPARPRFDASAFDRSSQRSSDDKPAVAPTVEESKPTLNAEARPVFKPEPKPVFKEEPKPEPAATSASSKHEEVVAQKSKSRFFGGDFASTESVRLKVEKRPEERPAAEPIVAKAEPMVSKNDRPAQPAPEPKPAEMKARNAEEHMAAGFAYEAKPLEQPSNAYRGTTETAALRTAASERANINPQKEIASMDAKGHESDNGATVKTDGSGSVAAIAIERNSKFSGQLKFSGAIAIDGQVEGELVAERIVVHEGGVVNATVEGNTVVIAGTVKGDVYARNELEILPSGIVHGSVTAPAINVRRGGRVEGRCAIGVPRQ